MGLTREGKPLSKMKQIRSQWSDLQKLIAEEVRNRINSETLEQLIKKQLEKAVSSPNFQSLTSDTPSGDAEWHEEEIAFDETKGGKGNTENDIQWHLQQILHDMMGEEKE